MNDWIPVLVAFISGLAIFGGPVLAYRAASKRNRFDYISQLEQRVERLQKQVESLESGRVEEVGRLWNMLQTAEQRTRQAEDKAQRLQAQVTAIALEKP